MIARNRADIRAGGRRNHRRRPSRRPGRCSSRLRRGGHRGPARGCCLGGHGRPLVMAAPSLDLGAAVGGDAVGQGGGVLAGDEDAPDHEVELDGVEDAVAVVGLLGDRGEGQGLLVAAVVACATVGGRTARRTTGCELLVSLICNRVLGHDGIPQCHDGWFSAVVCGGSLWLVSSKTVAWEQARFK